MPTPTLEYRTVDKSDWGPGAWQDEPDKRQWEDPTTGLACLIVRGPGGALCGYVGVARGHPAHGLSYSHWSYGEDGERVPLTPVQEAINDLEAHGGLTFAHGCGHGDNPATGICHIPGDGEPDSVWWFGFDCAHSGDLSPKYDRDRRWGDTDTYKSQPYVERWVTKLAGQLAAMPDALQSSAASADAAA